MSHAVRIDRASSGRDRLRYIAVTISALIASLAGSAVPAAAEDCGSVCDYWHYYGPYDFTYIKPGLFAYPRCDWQGNCSPHLIYFNSNRRYGRITVRPAHPWLVPTEARR